jgi:DNA-binding GntR family transcriptional regulator
MTERHKPSGGDTSSRLQARLAGRILMHAKEQGFGVGAWLSENALAQAFGVSRTPVRGALATLARKGWVNAVPRRGYILKRAVREQDLEPYADTENEDDRLAERMAADRFAGALPDQVSEADLMRRYDVARSALARVLHRMAQDSVVERCDGHGWRFPPALDSTQLHDESYRFRLLIEPAGVLEPSFRLDVARAMRIKEEHLALLTGGWRQMSGLTFFELNTAFHEFIAECSGNRFFHQAMVHQNRLRRFFSYNWIYGPERMRESSAEHVGILDRLLEGDSEQAATLLRLHILNGLKGACRRFQQTAPVPPSGGG